MTQKALSKFVDWLLEIIWCLVIRAWSFASYKLKVGSRRL